MNSVSIVCYYFSFPYSPDISHVTSTNPLSHRRRMLLEHLHLLNALATSLSNCSEPSIFHPLSYNARELPEVTHSLAYNKFSHSKQAPSALPSSQVLSSLRPIRSNDLVHLVHRLILYNGSSSFYISNLFLPLDLQFIKFFAVWPASLSDGSQQSFLLPATF